MKIFLAAPRGYCAGASTPEVLVEEVVKYLKEKFLIKEDEKDPIVIISYFSYWVC